MSWAYSRFGVLDGIQTIPVNWVEVVAVPGHGHVHVRGACQHEPIYSAVYDAAAKRALIVARASKNIAGTVIDLSTMSAKNGRLVDIIVNYPGGMVGSDLIMPTYVALMGLVMGRRPKSDAIYVGQCLAGTVEGIGLPVAPREAVTPGGVVTLSNYTSINRLYLTCGKVHPRAPQDVEEAALKGKRKIEIIMIPKLVELLNHPILTDQALDSGMIDEGGLWGWMGAAKTRIMGGSRGDMAAYMLHQPKA